MTGYPVTENRGERNVIQTILFIHPDTYFLDFIKSFLEIKGFRVVIAADCVVGFRIAISTLPDLIISYKFFPNLDAMGFLIKKRTASKIASIPVFLMGDFTEKEIMEYKKENVKAFISGQVNPVILSERLYVFFSIEPPALSQTTPMLIDLHARGRIITIQIEGNLEPAKIELLNYLIRSFCRQRTIKAPKVFLIIPSLYPESVTRANIELLFKFTGYPELTIEAHNIKILTKNNELVGILKSHEIFQQFEVVKSYFEGLQNLQIDFNKVKNVPVAFLKKGSCYIFDLYDKSGKRIIPSLTRVTDEILSNLEERRINTLTYYSDMAITEIRGDEEEIAPIPDDKELFNMMLSEFEPVKIDTKTIEPWDEKHTLFFRKLKGKKILVITPDQSVVHQISNTLDIYFDIHYEKSGKDIESRVTHDHYIIVFVDASLQQPSAIEILSRIRVHATRRKISVVILAPQLNKIEAVKFRDSGTDNIIIAPFSYSKVLKKVFESVTADRRT
ncbi:MAG: hypothetical protein JW881_19875 [Spirochaetales bacterium]|nr:hypothetical protein [Spirochaetales bacterium]